MKKIGDIGEVTAIRYLQKHKYSIKTTNFKYGRFWEIDIIAQKDNMTYFIEVKYRQNLRFGYPEESISKQKMHKCIRTIEYYCLKNRLSLEHIQFDVISILKTLKNFKITHYKNLEI